MLAAATHHATAPHDDQDAHETGAEKYCHAGEFEKREIADGFLEAIGHHRRHPRFGCNAWSFGLQRGHGAMTAASRIGRRVARQNAAMQIRTSEILPGMLAEATTVAYRQAAHCGNEDK
jgi:hypothetical protein